MSAKEIAYDVANEVARRIVEDAREMQKIEALQNRLNMVFYGKSDFDDSEYWFGLFHIWKENEKLYMTRTEDRYSEFGDVWLHPIQLTEKNIIELFTNQNGNFKKVHMFVYFGGQKPEAELDFGNMSFDLRDKPHRLLHNVAVYRDLTHCDTLGPNEFKKLVLAFFDL